jgi:hypothetical protein
VAGVNEENEKRLNSPKRFADAFEGIDPTKVILRTFQDPAQLNDVIVGLED